MRGRLGVTMRAGTRGLGPGSHHLVLQLAHRAKAILPVLQRRRLMLRKMNSQVMAGAGLRLVLWLQDQYGKMVPSADVSASLPGSESCSSTC